MFNKVDMEHVTHVKQGHVECLWSLFGKEVFRRFSIRVVVMRDASKASFKITVTLFLEKTMKYIAD